LAIAAEAQLPTDPVERARVIAEIFQNNASQLTIFDRQANPVTRVGPRDLHGRPTLSPDGKRIAVIKADVDKETQDVWVLDVATGESIRLTTSQSREGAQPPVWSPDGSEIAYTALRGSYFGFYRQAADGKGTEELLYQSNAPVTLTEWSMDGRYLGYFSTDLAGGALFALPLETAGERVPIEILRSEHQLAGVHFSPDSHYVSYASDETGRTEQYVLSFAAAGGPDAGPWQVSKEGSQGLGYFRRDGRELYYLGANRAIMAMSVTPTATGLDFGEPTVVFQAPSGMQLGNGNASISQSGDRFIIAVLPPRLQQITVFDRQGNVVTRVGEPGVIVQPNLSPDGTRIVAMVNDQRTGSNDIWVFDIATGKATPLTSTPTPENAPIWSPNGRHVAYVATRESYAGIYRRAADGTGEEELLFRYTPGAGMVLTDWSPDGKFMTFFTGVLVLVPVDTDEDPLTRKEIDWLREEYDVVQGRFSPDGRFIAYLSNEANPDFVDVYARAFDPDMPEAPPPGDVLRVTQDGVNGMISWRQDAKEMYFLSREWEVMAVDITTTPTLTVGTPRLLFKLPGPLMGNPTQWKNVSPDGERFVFAMPAAPSRP